MIHPPLQVLRIFISAGHNFFGRARTRAGTHPQLEVSEANLVAGSGIEGDRYFDYKANYKGQITFFADEVYRDLCQNFKINDSTPAVFRRNILISGFDLNHLIGKEFEIQGIEFLGTEECSPCKWMDQAFAPGAYKALKGCGGLRAKILTDGVLHARQAA